MGELGEQRWAVISERGCEARGLPHAEAAGLMRRLKGERVSGLCVVTNEAAERLQLGAKTSPNGSKPPAPKPARRQRQRQRAAKT
jgi:hypothetical protein